MALPIPLDAPVTTATGASSRAAQPSMVTASAALNRSPLLLLVLVLSTKVSCFVNHIGRAASTDACTC